MMPAMTMMSAFKCNHKMAWDDDADDADDVDDAGDGDDISSEISPHSGLGC